MKKTALLILFAYVYESGSRSLMECTLYLLDRGHALSEIQDAIEALLKWPTFVSMEHEMETHIVYKEPV